MNKLNPNLRGFWWAEGVKPSIKNLTPTRNRVLYGGRASSKSWEFAGMAALIACSSRAKFLCVRRFQNKISESVYSLIKEQISNLGLKGFDIQKSKIIHTVTGSEFSFYGIERNVDEIKSFEGCSVLWIEEAHNLSQLQWEILEPTIRQRNSQIWISFNPRLRTDFVYQKFVINTPPKTLIRKINFDENPFLSETMKEVIEAKKAEDIDEYSHIYLGQPLSDSELAIIKLSWLEAAIDAHKKLPDVDFKGVSISGFDVADDGEDKCAVVSMSGSVCDGVQEWKAQEDELIKSVSIALQFANNNNAKYLGYDCVGVGSFVGSHLNDKGFKNHFRFNAGNKVYRPDRKNKDGILNGEFYSNLKAQSWWLLAARFRNTYNAVTKGMSFKPDELISFDSEKIEAKLLNKLIDELSTPRKDFDNTGRVKVESKKDLAKRDIASPNLADAFVIANSRGLVKGASNLKAIMQTDEKNKSANDAYVERMNAALRQRRF